MLMTLVIKHSQNQTLQQAFQNNLFTEFRTLVETFIFGNCTL